MKFATFAVAALLPLTALSAPAPTQPEDGAPSSLAIVDRDAEVGNIEKRSVSGTVKVAGLRYRTCPRTSCGAVGQYAKGTHLSLSCYTRVDTTTVDGDKGWAKMTNGHWVALGFGHYVGWSGSLYAC